MAKLSTQRPAALKIVGHSVTRVDAHAKVTGSAEFSGDRVDAKQLLYGKTLRSPYAHAEILRIDTEKAEALPGVHAVIMGLAGVYGKDGERLKQCLPVFDAMYKLFASGPAARSTKKIRAKKKR